MESSFCERSCLHFILFSREILLSRLEIILLRLVITQKLFWEMEWRYLPIKSSSSLFEARQVRSRRNKDDFLFQYTRLIGIVFSRYEDAEKDCSTVLSLNVRNVKAYFRRGQARVGLGHFIEAQRGMFSIFLSLCIILSHLQILRKRWD